MRPLVRSLSLSGAWAFALASTFANALIVEKCLESSMGTGPRVVLEHIAFANVAKDSVLSRAYRENMSKGWDAAMKEVDRNLLPQDLGFVDCWSYREDAAGNFAVPTIDDLPVETANNLHVEKIRVISWGQGSVANSQMAVHFAIIPILARDTYLKRNIPDRDVILLLKPSAAKPSDLLDAFIGTRMMAIVSVLAGVEVFLEGLDRQFARGEGLTRAGVCWADAVQSQIGWAERAAGALVTNDDNVWFTRWTAALRKENERLAKGKGDVRCIIK